MKKRDNRVWRRRHCLNCGATFSSEEAVRLELAWQVRSGKRLRPFSRDKLFLSLYRSCGHRKTALDDAGGLTMTVISKLPALMKDGAVNSRDLAQVIQVALNRFDKAASTHYQAFHRS